MKIKNYYFFCLILLIVGYCEVFFTVAVSPSLQVPAAAITEAEWS